MTREQIANLTQLASKALNLKIIGWSVKYSRESLLECLASLGQIQNFVHYPHLNTTYVKMRVGGSRTQLVLAALADSFPRTRIELEPSFDILEGEKGLEKPDITAFASSAKFFSDIAIYTDLKQFGSLRALNFSFFAKYNKWFCKASFYEQSSVDLILNKKQSVHRNILFGAQIKLERIRGASYYGGVSASKNVPMQEPQGARVQRAGEKQQLNTKFSQTEQCRFESTSGLKSHNSGMKKSKSCDKNIKECLPAYSTFKSVSVYIENALKINRSRRTEQKSQIFRSKSAGKSLKEQVQIQLGMMMPKSSSKRKLVFNTYTFDEKELLFLEIGNTNPNNQTIYVPIKNEKDRQAEIAKDQISYLNFDDLSDGYSAIEEGDEMQSIKEETFQVFCSKDSEKETSQVPQTKYSSDAEHSLPKSPSDSRFDCVFGSHSALNCGNIPLIGAYRYPAERCSQTDQLQYFAFPSY